VEAFVSSRPVRLGKPEESKLGALLAACRLPLWRLHAIVIKKLFFSNFARLHAKEAHPLLPWRPRENIAETLIFSNFEYLHATKVIGEPMLPGL
jgi:hypothetical protein